MEMNNSRWQATSDYVNDVFGNEDASFKELVAAAQKAGLPDIAVDAGVGRLLQLLTKTTAAKNVLEIGTLGGYSTLWLASALGPGGHVYTIESDEKHADFAEAQFEKLGLAQSITVVRGQALDVMEDAFQRMNAPIDVAFVDAEKTEYLEYFKLVSERIKAGGLYIADNALGSSDWWIDQKTHPTREAVDAFNRAVAGDARFDCAGVCLREGLLIARRRSI